MRTSIAALCFALLLPISTAFAGARWPTGGVSVDQVNRTLFGSLADARSSPDNSQYLFIYFDATGTSLTAGISAYDTAGHFGSCQTSAPQMVNALMAANNDAFMFASWDASGTCTHVWVRNLSAYAPKVP